MRLDVSLQQRLAQQLRLAPQIIQSIEILQLPILELQETIKAELEENPTLEVDEEQEEHEVTKALEMPAGAGNDRDAETPKDDTTAMLENQKFI